MKIKQLLAICGAVAALFLSVGNVSAQNDNGGGGGGGGNFGGGGGGGGGGFRNMDPAQRQQFVMNRYKDALGFTNDTDWSAVQPLVQKVMDAQRATRDTSMGRMFGRNRGGNNGGDNNGGNNGGGQRGGGMFGSTPSPEAQALQTALDNNAPAEQVKGLLAKYETSHQAKLAALKAAQDNLREVLSVSQEAQATLLGLLD